MTDAQLADQYGEHVAPDDTAEHLILVNSAGERLLGRKTMEVELLKEALDLARAKKPMLLSRSPLPGNTP